MAAPQFTTKSDYLGTVFVRASDGNITIYGNPQPGVDRITAIRWGVAVDTASTWNLAANSAGIVFVGSTDTTYHFDFSPAAEGDYSFTLEATNGSGTTSKTYTIGVGRHPVPFSNDFATVGPYDQWVLCNNTNEQVIGPAFVGNVLNLQGGSNPVSAGIMLTLFDTSGGAPNFALNVQTGPTDTGYGVCPIGTYTVPVKGLNTGSLTPPGYVLFDITFSLVDCSGGGTTDVTKTASDTLVLSELVQNSNLDHAFLFSDTITLVQGGVSTQLTGINVPPPIVIIPPGEPLPKPNPTANPGANCIFEFYEMMHPEDVEVLPVPKKYDQLGPMRFDKIGKIFGFRVRLIQNGTIESMPYAIFGDDSESNPHLNSALFSGSFVVRPGFDNVYEIQLPKSINTDVFRLTLGPTTDSFHRYNVFVKVHISGMQGQAKWLPIR